jgi:mRNA interferase HigB
MGAVMNVIAKSALVSFWNALPKGAPRQTAETAMTEWYAAASKASWSNFSELKKTFNSADMVAGNKVIFDVGGNKYRIVGLVAFRTKRIFVLFVGTHAQYDAIDVTKL